MTKTELAWLDLYNRKDVKDLTLAQLDHYTLLLTKRLGELGAKEKGDRS